MEKEKPETIPKAVILSGGRGVRLQPLTHSLPKPMVPVLNQPFLAHTLAYLKTHDIDNITLTLSYLPKAVQSYFEDGSDYGVKITYAFEDSPLGTAGAVKNAEHYLNSTIVVLNGDIFSDLDISEMLAFHRSRKAKATISLTWVDNPCAFGVVETDSEGRVKRFIEKPTPDKVTTNWINAGIYILEPEILKIVPAGEYYMFEKDLFPLLLALDEPIYGYPFNGYWLDVGNPEKYLQLNCDLLLSKVKSHLTGDLGDTFVYKAAACSIHPSAEIVWPVVIGSNCSIGREVQITGPVVIGSDCLIGEGAALDSAVLWNGVTVGAGARLKRCISGSYALIGANDQVIDCTIVGDHIRSERVKF
ncbi:sugar phosphate nucleotidyltransferase [Chloroflexota bacterium]